MAEPPRFPVPRTQDEGPYRKKGTSDPGTPAPPQPRASRVEWVRPDAMGAGDVPPRADPRVAKVVVAVAGMQARRPPPSPWTVRLVMLPFVAAAFLLRGALGPWADGVGALGLLTLSVFEARRAWRRSSLDL